MGKIFSKGKNEEITSVTDTDAEYQTSSSLYEYIEEFQRYDSREDSCSVASDWSFEDYSMSLDKSSCTYPEPDNYYYFDGHVGYPITAYTVHAEKRSVKDFRPMKTDTAFDYSDYTSNRYVQHETVYYNMPQFHNQNGKLDNSLKPLGKTSTLACNNCDKTDAMPTSNTGRLPLVWPPSGIPSPSSSITSDTYVKQVYSGLADMSRDTPSNTLRLFDPGPQAMDWRPEDSESSADRMTNLKQADLQGFRQNDTDGEYSDTSFRLSESTVENDKESSLSVEFMVEAFKETIALTVKVEDLLPYLTVLGIEDAELDCRKNSKDAVFHLISKIQSSEVDGKWQAFLDALNLAEYQYIADLLQCKTEKDHTIARELLKLITPVLAKNIEPDYFVDRLYEKKVITQQDMEEIRREKDRRGQTAASLMLLQKLPRLATNWVRIFRDVLRESGMEKVAEDFDSDASSKYKNKGRPLPRLPTSVSRTLTEPKLLEHATRSPSSDSGRSSTELTDDDRGRPLPRLPTSVSLSWIQRESKIQEHASSSPSIENSRSLPELTDDDRGRPLPRPPAYVSRSQTEHATRSFTTDSGRSSTELTDDDRGTTETDDVSTLCADDSIETTDTDLDGSRYARPSFPKRGGNASSANVYASVVYRAKKNRQRPSWKEIKRIKEEITKELRTEFAQGFTELKDHVTDTVTNALVYSSVSRLNTPEPTYVITDDYTADYGFRQVPIYCSIQRPRCMPDVYGSYALLR